jgi:SSS family solute:Na+ symporter
MLGVTARKTARIFYVSGRTGNWHIGISLATDVGGPQSAWGGLGLMGISGSWMLFTGLLGAWLSAVFLIPKVSELGHKYKFYFPEIFGHFYNGKVAF